MAYNFNTNPGTQGGSGPYGSVPGVIGLPPNIYSQVNDIKGASNLAPKSTDFIGTELSGQVAPDVQSLLQDKAATLGITSGSPGQGYGSFAGNNYLKNLGLTSEGLMRQGSQDYLSFLSGVGNTMTNPNLAFEVAQQNAVDASAPSPAAAASRMTSLVNNGSRAGYNFPQISYPSAPSAPTGMSGGWDPNAGYGNPPIAYGPGGGPNVGMSGYGSSTVGDGTALYGSSNDNSALNYYLNDYFNSLNPDYSGNGQDMGVNIGSGDQTGDNFSDVYSE